MMHLLTALGIRFDERAPISEVGCGPFIIRMWMVLNLMIGVVLVEVISGKR